MIRTQVVVAGAGPVGTVAAYYLAQQGIDVLVLEAGPDCAQDLRASTFHPPTLEMLDELGITPFLLDKGLKAPLYHYRDRRTGDVVEFDLSELSDITRYPYRLQCEQYHLARALAEKLESHPKAQVKFSSRLVYLNQDDTGVDLAFETPFAIEKVRADYVIGADGANSAVRKWLGIGFEGFTYPEKFLCLSTKEPLEEYFPNLAHVNYVADPEEWLVLLRVPSVWRILLPAQPDTPDAELTSDENRDRVFQRLIGKTGVQTYHRTIYRMHQRVAESFRQGRAFLVGDSAHLNNPLGGFGMNSGIHDAFNLCQRLTKIIKNGPDEESLEQFSRQRRGAARSFVQAQTIQTMEMMKASQAEAQAKRRDELIATQADPAKRRQFLLRQAMFQSLADAAAIA
ncbi:MULTISPECIES: NAD(P)/FAD-dependent oxidoreductase [unclassified Azospirillum]|uniref:FAD-dependent oxidoreductase n=1 Tax=unclassified Azospirillum TaxID=2630922 RepID=UPI000B721CFF|nr:MULTISPECIES: NAD(P)/FAD-dependent oxidoreductase [unclassified Azospirillum]SNS94324.1 3-(3-hydroxy-phenyl)propionate hydroxylase [Azospirillum sp. RU38E]SNT10881.1 3-(3-hydroxy-phenyl)propionate hydroxylase [Azospirillum sp. RU37A]